MAGDIAETKKRILITLDKELLDQIEHYCGEHGGITKSQFFTKVSMMALGSAETLPELLVDAFVRNAMDAEIRAQLQQIIDAKTALGIA